MSVPQTRPNRTSLQPVKNSQDFKNQIYQILAKFGDNSTLKYAQDEMREVMAEHITDSERMNTFIHLISDVNEHMKPMQKKEHLRIFGQLGELFGENIIPFMPKIIQFYQRKFKDIDPQLSQALADSLGVLFHFMLKNLEGKEESIDQLKIILRELHQNIIAPGKNQQVTASVCLAKVIQSSPASCIKKLLPKLANRIFEQINNPTTKCRAQILECVISIVLSIEKEFHPYVKSFLPFILEGAQSKDQETKKMAIDVIYTLAAILPPALSPFKDHFIEILNESRFDKQKPIREATIEAISALKDLPPQKQERVSRSDGPDKKASREDPTPRPREMPQEKFEIQVDKKTGLGGRQSPTGQGKQVTAVTQKKLMNARIMKSKSPVRKELLQQQQKDQKQKTSIFTGPVNKDFFDKVEKIENGIEIKIAQNQDSDEDEDQDQLNQREELNDSRNKDEQVSPRQYNSTSPRDETQEVLETEVYPVNDETMQSKSYLKIAVQRDSRSGSRKQSESFQNKNLNAQQSFNLKESSYKQSPSRDKIDITGLYGPEFNQNYGRISNISKFQPPNMGQAPQDGYNRPPIQQINNFVQNYGYSQQQPGDQEDTTGIDTTSFNNSLNYIFYELDKISNQQLRMLESMNSFQNFTRNEIDYLKSKIQTIEGSVDELMRIGSATPEEYGRQTFGSPQSMRLQFQNFGAGSYVPNTARDYYQNDFNQGGGYNSFRASGPQANGQNTSIFNQTSLLKASNQLNISRETFGQQNNQSRLQGTNNDWNKVSQLVVDGDLNEAYSQVLMRNKDEMLLIKLMGKSGICVDQLSKNVLDFLVQKITDMIQKRDFLNVLITWVHDISKRLIDDQYAINYNTSVSFVEALKRLSEDFSNSIPQSVRQQSKQAFEALSISFKFF
ncbi:armadillo beta-catenin-like repeat-containing protein [Stylonychia lemnae]|uniref:Armadillo beta-catenin-like repeat-containing protein n=1 Tax=Stylonychia lemnae TaxID=5949 RepID=A0A078A6F6_STYLE|nr:armadillo beta-catenin-like repeat-containing protein [Stylonychia lemnae]|eukprot:CDW76319.1 armadillo beta-catenin-like repeat-containing protein [Stylonychia lemnae]